MPVYKLFYDQREIFFFNYFWPISSVSRSEGGEIPAIADVAVAAPVQGIWRWNSSSPGQHTATSIATPKARRSLGWNLSHMAQ